VPLQADAALLNALRLPTRRSNQQIVAVWADSADNEDLHMPRQAIDKKHVWPLLDAVTRSYATNDLQKRADTLIAALVCALEAIEILEARIDELERERGSGPPDTPGTSSG
jgi:hypothetical protein